jgi:hypothetical protein
VTGKPVPARGRDREVPPPVRGVRLGQFAERRGTNQDPIALDQRQIGCDDELRVRKTCTDCRAVGFVEKPRENGAGFRVQRHRLPRSSSRSWAAR